MFTKDTDILLHKSLKERPLLLGDRTLKHDVDELVAMALPPCRVAVIDDVNTSESMGNQVFKALKSRFAATHITLDKGVKADALTVDDIRRRSEGYDAYIAVGSGTINDLCKYASFKDKKPYLVFPTAASMNGYVSANASISSNGFKHTLPAHMPKAVFCDYDVISTAPERLSKSGLGDSLARPTAQYDWLLSHLLLGTAYNDVPFALLKELEPQVFDAARGIATADRQSITALMQLLLLSGFGMVIANGSYPASQSEHMVAHAYDMMAHHAKVTPSYPTLHGEEIGVTTLAISRVQAQYIKHPPALKPLAFPADDMMQMIGHESAITAKALYDKKCQAITAASLSHDTMQKKWDEIAGQLEAVMLPPAQIEAILKAADAPLAAEALKWDNELYHEATQHAHLMRDRFTVLDLAAA
jgi:glycerol-1-phosphate dehydrogenase [NAD(P)+]